MKVCFSIGQLSDVLIGKLKNSMDGVEFFSYSSVRDMIKDSTMKHIFFDRIIISEKILGDVSSDIGALNNYVLEYSDSTTIVLICNKSNVDNQRIFSEVFNSPLYTPVLISKKESLDTFIEFVKKDIPYLKSKYFREEGTEVKAIVGRVSEDKIIDDGVDEPKSGIFGKLFGGKKNKSPKTKNENNKKDVADNYRKGELVESKSSLELTPGSFVPDAESTVMGGMNKDIGLKDFSVDVPISENAPGDGGLQSDSEQFKTNFEDLDDLGLGDFGERHTDTGYFYDEDELEIDNEIMKYQGNEEEYDSYVDEEELGVSTEDSFNLDASGVVLVTGIRGEGVSSYIAEYSVSLSQMGKRVLVVDLDYINNGILSFIDTLKFMEEGYSSGITNLKPYIEDGISVLSNGYGRKITSSDIRKVIGVFRGYDVVFIDCPLDCANILLEDLLCGKVIVRVSGNRGSLMSTFRALTDRTLISGRVEDCLFSKSEFLVSDKIEEYDEDVSFLKNALSFCRGNWLDKLD